MNTMIEVVHTTTGDFGLNLHLFNVFVLVEHIPWKTIGHSKMSTKSSDVKYLY